MPISFVPSARGGAMLAERLRDKLASSFGHLLEACRDHVALDEAAISRRIAEIVACARPRPEIYVIHRHCVVAAHASDLAGVVAAFAALCETPVAAPPSLTLRHWNDDSFSPAEAARYQWAFGDEGDTPVTLVAAPPDIFAQASGALHRAIETLQTADPALHGEIMALVGEVVLAQGSAGQGMTFDGVTAFYATGAIVMNAAENRSVPGALTTLVHEAGHCLLFAATEGAALVENPMDELFASPLRQDARPMNGVYHATFVSARVAYALDRVLQAGVFTAEAERRETTRLWSSACDAFASGYAVLQADGQMTACGAEFMRGAADSMAGMKQHARL